MKKTLLALILFAAAPSAFAKTELPALLGRWEFQRMIYRGQQMEPINPRLHIVYEFQEIGLNRLIYWRDDENGFCERRAIWFYHSSPGLLQQTVVWVNPSNRPDCARDADMQLGRESWTPVSANENLMSTVLPLGDETLTYLWRRLDD